MWCKCENFVYVCWVWYQSIARTYLGPYRYRSFYSTHVVWLYRRCACWNNRDYGWMYTLILTSTCYVTAVCAPSEGSRCFSSYCPGSYYTGSTCINGYCRCVNNPNRDYCSCLGKERVVLSTCFPTIYNAICSNKWTLSHWEGSIICCGDSNI